MSEIKICFITAIYGNYETTCKPFASQTIPVDFICFTDNENIESNGWIIDTNPYHIINKSPIDNDQYINSIINNRNTFNIAKYYKQAFINIPRLSKYDIIVWLDGTIKIINPNIAKYIVDTIYLHKIIGWHHEYRNGNLIEEVNASNFDRYTSTIYNNQQQPYQDIFAQYNEYLKDGYDEQYFKRKYVEGLHTSHLGVWITCMVAFLKNDLDIQNFLNLWYLQTLKYTTQDQIGFSYVCQKLDILPLTLPNREVKGDCPHVETDFYIKCNHGM